MGEEEKSAEKVEHIIEDSPVDDVKSADAREESAEDLLGKTSGEVEDLLKDLAELSVDEKDEPVKDDGEPPVEDIIELTEEISDDEDEPGIAGDKGERILKEDDKIYELLDVVEEAPQEIPPDSELSDEIAKRVSEIAEKVAREIMPEIAERIIREEIEKLKSDGQ